jgi:hypothetical protein
MRRSLIIISFACAIFFQGIAHSEDEERTGQIEDSQMIINAGSATNGASGVILALSCPECPSRRFTFDQSTSFFLGGAPVEFEDLGRKIDWRGMIMFSIANPSHASKVFLHKPESP